MIDARFRPVALVTGASSGIGAATVRQIAARCRAVAVHARASSEVSRAGLAASAAIVEAAGAEALTLTGDLSEAGVGTRLVEAALARFGALDHIVSNAGFADKRSLDQLSRADLDHSYAGMAAAFFEIINAARSAVIASDSGRIVLLSSFVAHRFAQGAVFPASAAAKAAGEALMRAAAAEFAPHAVTVNAVVPGYTRKDGGHTALAADAWARAAQATPLGRIAEPSDIAALVAFLLSPEARHITGQAIAVDGGLSLG